MINGIYTRESMRKSAGKNNLRLILWVCCLFVFDDDGICAMGVAQFNGGYRALVISIG